MNYLHHHSKLNIMATNHVIDEGENYMIYCIIKDMAMGAHEMDVLD